MKMTIFNKNNENNIEVILSHIIRMDNKIKIRKDIVSINYIYTLPLIDEVFAVDNNDKVYRIEIFKPLNKLVLYDRVSEEHKIINNYDCKISIEQYMSFIDTL